MNVLDIANKNYFGMPWVRYYSIAFFTYGKLMQN